MADSGREERLQESTVLTEELRNLKEDLQKLQTENEDLIADREETDEDLNNSIKVAKIALEKGRLKLVENMRENERVKGQAEESKFLKRQLNKYRKELEEFLEELQSPEKKTANHCIKENKIAEEDSKKFPSTLELLDLSTNCQPVVCPTAKDELVYSMDLPSRGTVLIFNHMDFSLYSGRLSDRIGTEIDCDRLKTSFEVLGFQRGNIVIHNDLSVMDMEKTLKEVASADHSQCDCLIVTILSHGDGDHVLAVDGKFRIEELWHPFIASKCQTLAGKPKIFIIQACRGSKCGSSVECCRRETTDGIDESYKISEHADFLFAFSTIPGHVSWRNHVEGTWYINELCSVLDEFGQTEDLVSLLTRVNHNVSINYESKAPDRPHMDRKKQMPSHTNVLTRKVFFHPKQAKDKVDSVSLFGGQDDNSAVK